MTSREIVLANLNHEGPARPGMTFDNGRLNDFVHAGLGGANGCTHKRWIEGQMEYYDDQWGNLWMRMKDGCAKGEVVKPAIADWSQLDDYQAPDYDLDVMVSRLREGLAGPTDKFRVVGLGGWIFDNARYIRKMDTYFMDMVMYPEELRRLHSIVAGVYEKKIRACGESGVVDAIEICEDMGTQTGLLFSPEMWRDYFKDDYTRLFAMAHDYGLKILMHSCGYNWEIVPDLLEAGVDCFQFDQPAVYDMPALAAKLKEHRAALWSPVDIQKIMPSGDREVIEAGAREMCEIFDGFLICKNYPDLSGIGIEEEWDNWAYNAICGRYGLPGV